jgi:transposase-like protein
MASSRRFFSKAFKTAAVRRIELGASPVQVAIEYEVHPHVLQRWQQEYAQEALTNDRKNPVEVQAKECSVSFRMNRDQFRRFMEAYSKSGAYSISDFARAQVLQGIAESSPPATERTREKKQAATGARE